jgi:exodeoxyribonuclease VII large subunit
VPLNIGLITSHDSAAYNDFISELKFSGYAFKVFYRNALMQGKETQMDVCRALDELNRISSLDAIVITRGGGSIADLSWFDSQCIAEKISISRLPVLSGIGHEINITITDLTAHTYQKTPTAIAQFLVEKVESFLTDIEEKSYQIINYAREKINAEKKDLKESALSLQNKTHYFLKSHHQDLVRYLEVIKRQPLKLLEGRGNAVEEKGIFILKAAQLRLKQDMQKIRNYQRIIEIAHPQNTLKRGFSITRDKAGNIVRSIKKVDKGDIIKTCLMDGYLGSQIVNKTGGGNGRDKI